MSSSFTPKRDEVAASSADEVELRRGRRDRLGGVKADDLGGIEAFGLIVPLIRRLLNVLVASDDPMRKTHDRGSLMKMSVRLGSTIALVVLATAGSSTWPGVAVPRAWMVTVPRWSCRPKTSRGTRGSIR